MIKTIQSLGLAGLLALASCEKSITDFRYRKVQGEIKHPQAIYQITTDPYTNLWGIDIDGDGIIDEAVQAKGFNTRGWSLAGVMQDMATHLPRDKWQHLIAPEFKEKSYIITDNTREMTPEERATLTSAYKLLQNLKK